MVSPVSIGGVDNVAALADQAAGLEVGQDALEQRRIAQQRQCFAALVLSDGHAQRLRSERIADLLVLHAFEFEQHPTEIGLERFLRQLQLHRRLGDEARPWLRWFWCG